MVDVVTEVIETAVHQLLYTRKVYPEVYFEKRRKYGMEAWRCKSPEVNAYVSRVLANAEPLLAAGAVQEIIFSTVDGTGTFVDQIAFRLSSISASRDNNGSSGSNSSSSSSSSNSSSISNSGPVMDRASLNLLEKQLQSLLLQLSMVDGTVGTFQPGWAWDLCLLLLPDASRALDGADRLGKALTSALQTQEWFIDGGSVPATATQSEPLGTVAGMDIGLSSSSSAHSAPRPPTAKAHLLRPITSVLFNCDVLVFKTA